jgi:hypothetical protein
VSVVLLVEASDLKQIEKSLRGTFLFGLKLFKASVRLCST